MEFELICLDGWLNWPRGNIFRQDSEPKLLQIQRNLFGNTQNPPPKKSPKDQKRPDFWKPIAPKSQWDFLTNRELELIYKARQMRNQKVIWYKNVFYFVSFLCVKSSRTHFWKVGFQAFSEKLVLVADNRDILRNQTYWLLITEPFLGIRPIGCW